jgi:hypothetical protein
VSGVEGLAGFSTGQSTEWFRREALAAISRLERPNLFGRGEGIVAKIVHLGLSRVYAGPFRRLRSDMLTIRSDWQI